MGVRWVERDLALRGTVLFRGGIPLRLEELKRHAGASYEVETLPVEAHEHWSCRLRHPAHGVARVTCPREPEMPGGPSLQFDPRLTTEEKAAILSAGSFVEIRLEAQERDLLRERKRLLHFFSAAGGDAAVGALDGLALCWWSPQALAEELAHDAPVDISALFTIHLVGNEGPVPGERTAFWLHTHGLQEAGYTDFDVLNPSPSSHGRGFDSVRAIAYAIVEGALAPGSEPVSIVWPGGEARLVSAREFLNGAGADVSEWREAVDEFHLSGHAVVCDAALERRFFGLGRPRAKPSAFFQSDMPDGSLIQFSRSASDLMADRARQTYDYFRGLREEFAAYELPVLAKLGYPVDGDPEGREHIWFEIHGCDGDSIDATCINDPYGIASLSKDQRGKHSVELLSDWAIFTPFGAINPRFQYAARRLRADPAEARRLLAEHRHSSE
jgi:hypothetical protein